MRYIPLTNADREAMLRTIGAASVEELFSTIPAAVRRKTPPDLPASRNEQELQKYFQDLAHRNEPAPTHGWLSFLGGGAYEHFIPTVVDALAIRRPEWLRDEPVLYACGPEQLLGAAAALAAAHGLGCQVSLEGIYGCGLGLCRGCAVPLREEPRYLMQCVEGPVVDAHRIDWERYLHE